MEELLNRLKKALFDGEIVAECGNRIFMNNRKTQVQTPYISFNPMISGKPFWQIETWNDTIDMSSKFTCQVNLYCATSYDFTKMYNLIKKSMKKQGFKLETEFIDTTETGNTWICMRYSLKVYSMFEDSL